jgi:hypothetical protein
MPGKIAVVKERYHVHMDAIEKPCLVDRYIDGMVTRLEQEVSFFRGLDPYRQEDRPAAGSTDTKITVPLVDIFNNFRNDSDFSQSCSVMRMGKHVASIIGSTD